jgi:hypothetical protein
MKIIELLNGTDKPSKKSFNLIDKFEIWTTNEEAELLKKLSKPVKLNNLSETEQFRIASMIRKSLVTKIGMIDPSVVANEKIQ